MCGGLRDLGPSDVQPAFHAWMWSRSTDQSFQQSMASMKLQTFELGQLRNDINAVNGDPGHPTILAKYSPLEIDFSTSVDQDLCPFSDEYFEQQVALYQEISGRALNQEDGELHLANAEELIAAPNPLGLRDVAHMSEYSRAILAMLSLASLPAEANVLDMGAGHGVSSELLAFCGCSVDAVDIDPVLGGAARIRAQKRNYAIRRHDMNFDDLEGLSSNSYSAAFFYQSLHHCLRPWDLIAQLKAKLRSDAVIAFAGEPVQSLWWKQWGLRLDLESIYVAREYGWFESGWSHDFISECFARSGMQLLFFTGGLKGGEIGIAAADIGTLERCRARANEIGVREIREPFCAGPDRYLSQVGVPKEVVDRPGFCQNDGAAGVLMFGPYADLPPGSYDISIVFSYESGVSESLLTLDMVSDRGRCEHWREEIHPKREGDTEIFRRQFELAHRARNAEFRAQIAGPRNWAVSVPTLVKLAG
jgi:2-polyprenyl-3-methyl-5-hydroxy-6-metoxy-1,4-benzoquinol methylase